MWIPLTIKLYIYIRFYIIFVCISKVKQICLCTVTEKTVVQLMWLNEFKFTRVIHTTTIITWKMTGVYVLWVLGMRNFLYKYNFHVHHYLFLSLYKVIPMESFVITLYNCAIYQKRWAYKDILILEWLNININDSV